MPLASPAPGHPGLSRRPSRADRPRWFPPMAIVPDTKNWTWVLARVCPECGFDAATVERDAIGRLVRDNAAAWPALLLAATARRRPTPDRWSALEYGCHVRDVFRLFDERLRLMLEHDGPHFDNWDQDATAVAERNDLQHPNAVARELVAAGAELADRWDRVGADQWERTGFRGDGTAFTVDSFARYFLHDPVHHLADVAAGNRLIDTSSG